MRVRRRLWSYFVACPRNQFRPQKPQHSQRVAGFLLWSSDGELSKINHLVQITRNQCERCSKHG